MGTREQLGELVEARLRAAGVRVTEGLGVQVVDDVVTPVAELLDASVEETLAQVDDDAVDVWVESYIGRSRTPPAE